MRLGNWWRKQLLYEFDICNLTDLKENLTLMHQFCASFENFILFGLNFLMAYLNLDIPQGKIWKHTRVYHIAKSLTCKKPPTHRLRKNVSIKVEGMLQYRHPSSKRRVYHIPKGLRVQKSTYRNTRVWLRHLLLLCTESDQYNRNSDYIFVYILISSVNVFPSVKEVFICFEI